MQIQIIFSLHQRSKYIITNANAKSHTRMSSDTQADMAVFGFLRIDGHLVHHLRDGLVLQYTSTLYHSIIR